MTSKIKICTGPGCKAWKSVIMARRLKRLQGKCEISLVPCMNKCGGGASIRLKDRGRIIKLKEPREVLKLFETKVVALAEVS